MDPWPYLVQHGSTYVKCYNLIYGTIDNIWITLGYLVHDILVNMDPGHGSIWFILFVFDVAMQPCGGLATKLRSL